MVYLESAAGIKAVDYRAAYTVWLCMAAYPGAMTWPEMR